MSFEAEMLRPPFRTISSLHSRLKLSPTCDFGKNPVARRRHTRNNVRCLCGIDFMSRHVRAPLKVANLPICRKYNFCIISLPVRSTHFSQAFTVLLFTLFNIEEKNCQRPGCDVIYVNDGDPSWADDCEASHLNVRSGDRVWVRDRSGDRVPSDTLLVG
jgi:hypothetical protein